MFKSKKNYKKLLSVSRNNIGKGKKSIKKSKLSYELQQYILDVHNLVNNKYNAFHLQDFSKLIDNNYDNINLFIITNSKNSLNKKITNQSLRVLNLTSKRINNKLRNVNRILNNNLSNRTKHLTLIEIKRIQHFIHLSNNLIKNLTQDVESSLVTPRTPRTQTRNPYRVLFPNLRNSRVSRVATANQRDNRGSGVTLVEPSETYYRRRTPTNNDNQYVVLGGIPGGSTNARINKTLPLNNNVPLLNFSNLNIIGGSPYGTNNLTQFY